LLKIGQASHNRVQLLAFVLYSPYLLGLLLVLLLVGCRLLLLGCLLELLCLLLRLLLLLLLPDLLDVRGWPGLARQGGQLGGYNRKQKRALRSARREKQREFRRTIDRPILSQ
jgi:hypothetical protein